MKDILLKGLVCAAFCLACLSGGASGVYAAEAPALSSVDSLQVQDGGPEPSSQPDTEESTTPEPSEEESGEPPAQPDTEESTTPETPEEESGEPPAQPDTEESTTPEPPEEESGEPPSQPDTGESNSQESPETKEEAETPPLPVQESGVCACEGCQTTALAFALPFTECN